MSPRRSSLSAPSVRDRARRLPERRRCRGPRLRSRPASPSSTGDSPAPASAPSACASDGPPAPELSRGPPRRGRQRPGDPAVRPSPRSARSRARHARRLARPVSPPVWARRSSSTTPRARRWRSAAVPEAGVSELVGRGRGQGTKLDRAGDQRGVGLQAPRPCPRWRRRSARKRRSWRGPRQRCARHGRTRWSARRGRWRRALREPSTRLGRSIPKRSRSPRAGRRPGGPERAPRGPPHEGGRHDELPPCRSAGEMDGLAIDVRQLGMPRRCVRGRARARACARVIEDALAANRVTRSDETG